MAFTVGQIYNILNTSAQESFGAVAPTVKNGSDFVSLGNLVFTSTDNKETFLGKLTNVIGKTVVRNRSYITRKYPFLCDPMEFGAIYRKIKVFDPNVEADPEWDCTMEADQFAYKPVNAVEYLYQKMTAWSKTLSIPDNQLKSAFQTETEMTAFLSSIYTQIENAINIAIETLCRMALATFIAEKIHLQSTQSNKIHVVNVLEKYNALMGTTLLAAHCYTDKEFMRFLSREIGLYKGRIQEMSQSFNSTAIAVHTPEEYMDLYLHSEVTTGFASYLYGDTYHEDYVKLPNFHEIPYWQAPGLNYAIADTTAIDIKLASDNTTVVNTANVLGVLVDREAIATIFQLDETETTRNGLKKYTNQIRTATRGMLCDLSESGIVFIAADPA